MGLQDKAKVLEVEDISAVMVSSTKKISMYHTRTNNTTRSRRKAASKLKIKK
jgi:hypothetical protein